MNFLIFKGKQEWRKVQILQKKKKNNKNEDVLSLPYIKTFMEL